ncbi:tetratricopeptide repeat-containing sensor histidine kinase [Aestuariivivens sp. NBU2969]|uniref:tetratricopeptide repeat-containing sensor histidine kinase n=1 Tax=Aestuariivivens sp. NBU2969 TaxID=2873267 RepID=UPI001CBC2FD4|nr:tetratricopeptide repeat-containing sensor histidine kinase [Aestuariivivens sp. NBU2969]
MRKLITLGTLLIMFLGFSQTQDIDSLTIQLAFQKQDTLKAKTSLELIKLLYDKKDYNKAVKFIVKTEKLATDLDYKKGLADVIYYKALIYAHKNDYINAISSYAKCKDLYNTLNDTLGIAKVNNGIGLIEIKRGNYAKGLQYALSAIEILEQQDLKQELSLAYSNLADAYYNISAYDKAINFYLKALPLQQILGDIKGINISYSKLADLYSMKKEHRKAIEYYKNLLNANIENDSIQGVVSAKLGGEYLQFNDFTNASKYLLQGLNLNRRNDNQAGLLTTLNHLGTLNLNQGRLILAERQLYEAGTMAKSLDNKQELLRYYNIMKRLDSTRKRFDRAFVWQREYYSLKTSLEQKRLSAIDIDSNIDIDINPTLNLDNTIEESGKTLTSQAEVDKQKSFKLLFYILLAILVMAIVFIILTNSKRMDNIKLVQSLEEKNLKANLQHEADLEQIKHLENINNVKDKLFSIISHDLKDSLSSINGFIDLLKDDTLSKEEFDNLIPELSDNASNASLLLFNLLNWSKSQMQSLEPKPSLFDIQEVFEDKVNLVEQRMAQKGINLIDHSLRDFAYADRSMIEIVIQNLLANALKFCNKGDTITVSNHISNGSCILSIADTGVGISKENLGKLFKSSTFTTAGTNNEKGTGLGLSICKELVELNNGKIWVESTLNVGTTFYVQLPKSKPA